MLDRRYGQIKFVIWELNYSKLLREKINRLTSTHRTNKDNVTTIWIPSEMAGDTLENLLKYNMSDNVEHARVNTTHVEEYLQDLLVKATLLSW